MNPKDPSVQLNLELIYKFESVNQAESDSFDSASSETTSTLQKWWVNSIFAHLQAHLRFLAALSLLYYYSCSSTNLQILLLPFQRIPESHLVFTDLKFEELQRLWFFFLKFASFPEKGCSACWCLSARRSAPSLTISAPLTRFRPALRNRIAVFLFRPPVHVNSRGFFCCALKFSKTTQSTLFDTKF